tara:strand:+ start:31598 stop:31849 length:252 start_codon:yes stop_codon:yes gene_type:complete
MFIALCLILVFSLAGCKTARDPQGLPDERDACGECLDMPTGEVCTEQGETLRNSCLAICRGYKIKCFQGCPCPKEEEKGAKNN